MPKCFVSAAAAGFNQANQKASSETLLEANNNNKIYLLLCIELTNDVEIKNKKGIFIAS